MNGAEMLLRTARKNGIDTCFANAGTTEIPVVAALDKEPGIRSVLGLFEGVCTGAADGYGRVLDRPAMVLLHLGPGFANGIACLHNARRAHAPIVNIIGEHSSWHRDSDPPLNMDIKALAGTVSGWKKTSRGPGGLSRDMAAAIGASMAGQIASLIVPNDYQWALCKDHPIAEAVPFFEPADNALIEEAVRVLSYGKRPAMILGGRALRREGLAIAARIRAATGCDLLANSFPGYMDRGGGLPVVTRIPYFPEPAMEMLSGYDAFVLAGSHEPVTFFGYEGVPSYVIPEGTRKVSVAGRKQDVRTILETLADLLGASKGANRAGLKPADAVRPAVPLSGPLTPETVSRVVAALQPENAIIVDEGLTTTFPYYPVSYTCAPHGFMTIAGGSIGYGMPCAVGASLAAPDRPVINIQADGGAMYTVQALWTMARNGLNVTTLLCNNGGYRIIAVELERAGLKDLGENASRLVDIDGPPIDWVLLARGLGVPAVRVDDAEGLAREMNRAAEEPGPHLIEMMII